MRKNGKVMVLLATAMVLGLAGCNGADNAAATTAGTTPAVKAEAAADGTQDAAGGTELTTADQTFILATQSVDTTVYSRAAAIVEVLGQGALGSNTIEIQPISTGGAAGALLAEEDQCDFSTGSNVPGKKLAEGTYEEGRAPLQNVAAVCGGTDITWGTIMFTDDFVKKTGYTTLEEVFEAKYPVRIVTKAPGSFGMDGATDLLDCFGLTWEDIDSWGGASYHIAPSQMTDMLKEGSADVSIDIISIGQPAFTELCMTSTMHVIELDSETRTKMNEKGYNSMTMPANSWNGQTEPIETVCGCETILVRKDVPDDVVYAMTKGICEQKAELVKLVPAMEGFDPSVAWDIAMTGVELHPGAEQYYKDAGLMK